MIDMDEKVTDIYKLVKNNDIFDVNILAKIALVVLYIDYFLGCIAPMFNLEIEQFSDVIEGKFILLLVISTMLFIILMKVCIAILSVLFLKSIASVIIAYFCPYKTYGKTTTYKTVSADSLKAYALLNNNAVAEHLSKKLEKSDNDLFYNTNVIIGMSIFLSLDAFYGKYMTQIIGASHISIVVVFVSIIIIIFKAVHYYYNGEHKIALSNDVADRITAGRKSPIED